jgi:hypothetical protein
MPSIVVYNFGRISIVLRRHFPDALAWGQAGFEGLGILSGDGHYRNLALCRVSYSLPSVLFRALGKELFAECHTKNPR